MQIKKKEVRSVIEKTCRGTPKWTNPLTKPKQNKIVKKIESYETVATSNAVPGRNGRGELTFELQLLRGSVEWSKFYLCYPEQSKFPYAVFIDTFTCGNQFPDLPALTGNGSFKFQCLAATSSDFTGAPIYSSLLVFSLLVLNFRFTRVGRSSIRRSGKEPAPGQCPITFHLDTDNEQKVKTPMQILNRQIQKSQGWTSLKIATINVWIWTDLFNTRTVIHYLTKSSSLNWRNQSLWRACFRQKLTIKRLKWAPRWSL